MLSLLDSGGSRNFGISDLELSDNGLIFRGPGIRGKPVKKQRNVLHATPFRRRLARIFHHAGASRLATIATTGSVAGTRIPAFARAHGLSYVCTWQWVDTPATPPLAARERIIRKLCGGTFAFPACRQRSLFCCILRHDEIEHQ